MISGIKKTIPRSFRKKISKIFRNRKEKINLVEDALNYKGSSGVTTNKRVHEFGEALRLSREDNDACSAFIDCLGRTILMKPGHANAWSDSRCFAIQELHKSYWLLRNKHQERIRAILQDALQSRNNPSIDAHVKREIVDALRNTITSSIGDVQYEEWEVEESKTLNYDRAFSLPAIVAQAAQYEGSSGVTTNTHIREFGDALRRYRDTCHREVLIECLGRTVLMPTNIIKTHAWADSRCLAIQEFHKSYWQLNSKLRRKVSDILELALVQSYHNSAINESVQFEIVSALRSIKNGEKFVGEESSQSDEVGGSTCDYGCDSYSGGLNHSIAKRKREWVSTYTFPVGISSTAVVICLVMKMDFIIVYVIVMMTILFVSRKGRA